MSPTSSSSKGAWQRQLQQLLRGCNGLKQGLFDHRSLSWDLVFFYALSRANGDSRFDGRPLDDLEIDWIRDRQINALRLLRETFPASKVRPR